MENCMGGSWRNNSRRKYSHVIILLILVACCPNFGEGLVVLHPLSPEGSVTIFRHIMAVFGATRGLGFKSYSFVGNVTYYDKNPCAPMEVNSFEGNFVLFDVSKATSNYTTCSFTELASEVEKRNGAGMLVFDEEDKLYIMSSASGIYGTRHSINIPCAWTEKGLADFVQKASARGDYVEVVLNATADIFLDGNFGGGMFDSVVDLFKSGLIGVMTASSLIMLVRLTQILFSWCRDLHGRYIRRRRLRGIPVKHYSVPNDDMEPDVCAICLDSFSEGENVNELPCNHLFHRACIWKWLESSPLCPICKQNVFPDATVSEEELYEPRTGNTDNSFAWWNSERTPDVGSSSQRDVQRENESFVFLSDSETEEPRLHHPLPSNISPTAFTSENDGALYETNRRQANGNYLYQEDEVHVVVEEETANEENQRAHPWLSSIRNLGRAVRFRLLE
eukprot:jgi/Galph1/2790/GphlegSOOS_G1460.1